MLSLNILIVALTAFQAVLAQFPTNQGPPCVQQCASSTQSQAGTLAPGVDPNNLAGLCATPAFVQQFGTCLVQSCNAADASEGADLGRQICSAAAAATASAASSVASSVLSSASASAASSASSASSASARSSSVSSRVASASSQISSLASAASSVIAQPSASASVGAGYKFDATTAVTNGLLGALMAYVLAF